MSKIQIGYVRNMLTDDIDSEDLRYYKKSDGSLVVAARTTEGFITYCLDKAAKVLTRDNITPDFIEKMNGTGADLAFAVVDENDDVYLVEIDADGCERAETPFIFGDIWEVTYDDYEEFLDDYPEELFRAFDMY